jgi:glycosyltransferase involved in cell wall biosynthesis
MKQLVDVVIPVFNGAGTVQSAIESIQRQTYKEIRVIVVDDGSTDETPRILRETAAADVRVQIIAQTNSGIVDALNLGLANCEAEFVARHDADDLAAPDRFEKQVAYLQANPDCVAVSGAHRYLDDEGLFHGLISPRFNPPEAADPLWIPAREPYLLHPFLMSRRLNLQILGGYRHVVHAEDSDLYWRMQEIGRLHNLEDVLGDYRLLTSSVSARSIINGRHMAFSSQLAAISALRRRSGNQDITFTKEKALRVRGAEKLSDIFALGCEDLSREEVDHLEIAVAAKLLELSSWRPYELDLHDCQFIHSAMSKHANRASPPNRRILSRACAGTAARLLHEGLIREAVALMPPTLYPVAIGRLALRTIASPAQLVALRKALGREPNVLMK